MIKIPLDTGAIIVEDGIEIYASVGDADIEPDHICWSTLVNDLLDGYTIPNHRGMTIIRAEDYDYLVEVLQGINGAATLLHTRLNKAEIT